MLEGGRSSEYEEKPKRAKIEPKQAKIGTKRAQIEFYNVEGTQVMVEPTSVDARESGRTRS